MKLRHAMVCASNQNRSMEAHALLQKQGLDVSSYGTGTNVKLPGPSAREPNVYQFGTPYRQMHEDLKNKDPELYKRNGLLQMLKRNSGVKESPQRWQDNAADGAFDVVFTFEERVFDMVIDDLENRETRLLKLALVINLDVKDNHEEAAIGGRLALDLCQRGNARRTRIYGRNASSKFRKHSEAIRRVNTFINSPEKGFAGEGKFLPYILMKEKIARRKPSGKCRNK